MINYLIGATLLVIVFFAIKHVVKPKKIGSCGCGCSGNTCNCCHTNSTDQKKGTGH